MTHSHKVGRFTVTWLVDGYGRAPNTLFPNFDMDRARAAAEQAGHDYDGQTVEIPIQGFAIQDGDEITIVDAGAPDGYSDTTGNFVAAMEQAGIDPTRVTRLAMTHLHVDHVGQMVEPDGTMRFPNAQLVSGAGDWDHFFDDAFYASKKPGGREQASIDVTRRACLPYAQRRREITGETEIAPGLTMVPLPGHTPGHCGIRIDDGGDSLLIWGDIIHSATFQVAEPDWGVLFDIDPDQARATRQALFAKLAQDGTPITGPHVPRPGPWRVEKAPIGYRLTAI